MFCFFWPCDMWDLVSPSRDWTHTLCSPAVESEVLATEPGGKSLSTLYRYPCACGYLSLLSPCSVNALDSVCLCVSLLHTKGVRLVAWNPSWLGVFTPWNWQVLQMGLPHSKLWLNICQHSAERRPDNTCGAPSALQQPWVPERRGHNHPWSRIHTLVSPASSTDGPFMRDDWLEAIGVQDHLVVG